MGLIDRLAITVEGAPGGWLPPWPGVAEIEAVLPREHWSLIGGLMVQLHAIHHRIDAVRPTNDIDLMVHVETGSGRAAKVSAALVGLGYELRPPVDLRHGKAHRFVRGSQSIDVVTSTPTAAVVDVVLADHAAHSAHERLGGHEIARIEGGTQALRRTVDATLTIVPGRATVISVPDAYGALILKSAAHRADHRDPDRHLADAAVLLACVDPFLERSVSGSDRSRLLHLDRTLADPLHPAWLRLPSVHRRNAQDALSFLCE